MSGGEPSLSLALSFGHQAERVGAHAGGNGVVVGGLIERPDGADGAVEQGNLGGKGVAEEAGNTQGNVDAGAAQPGQGDDLVTRDAQRAGILDGPRADQRQRLGNIVAAGAHIGRAPDRQSDRTEMVAMVLQVAEDQAFGGLFAEIPSRWGGHSAVVEREEIAAGRQHVEPAARGSAGGTGGDELTIQAIEQCLDFGGTGGGQTGANNGLHGVEHGGSGGPGGVGYTGTGDQIGGDGFETFDDVALSAQSPTLTPSTLWGGSEGGGRPRPWRAEFGCQRIKNKLEIIGQGT